MYIGSKKSWNTKVIMDLQNTKVIMDLQIATSPIEWNTKE
jgi:hypothetical protein